MRRELKRCKNLLYTMKRVHLDFKGIESPAHDTKMTEGECGDGRQLSYLRVIDWDDEEAAKWIDVHQLPFAFLFTLILGDRSFFFAHANVVDNENFFMTTQSTRNMPNVSPSIALMNIMDSIPREMPNSRNSSCPKAEKQVGWVATFPVQSADFLINGESDDGRCSSSQRQHCPRVDKPLAYSRPTRRWLKARLIDGTQARDLADFEHTLKWQSLGPNVFLCQATKFRYVCSFEVIDAAVFERIRFSGTVEFGLVARRRYFSFSPRSYRKGTAKGNSARPTFFSSSRDQVVHTSAERIRSPIDRMVHSEFFIGVLIAVFLDRVIADEKSLFSNEDQILQLDVDNFNQKVYSQFFSPCSVPCFHGRAFFVEFYSSWCGACIAYAPLYKKFALDVQAWKPIIEVGAVNCADDKNSRICREHAIDAFPTIKRSSQCRVSKVEASSSGTPRTRLSRATFFVPVLCLFAQIILIYFKYMSKGKEDGIRYEGNKHELATLPLDVAQLVRDDWLKQRPPQWPSFDYADKYAFNNWLLKSLRAEYAGSDSLANWLNTHRLQLQYGVSCANDVWTWFHEKINFAKDKRVHIVLLSSGDALAKSLVERTFLSEDHLATDTRENCRAVDCVTAPPVVQQTEQTITASWNQFERKYLLLNSQRALRAWHSTDSTTLASWDLSETSWNINRLNNSDLGYPLPTNMTWIACRGSKPYLRGYSCGLWTLLHTITVEAFRIEQNSEQLRFAVLLDKQLNIARKYRFNYAKLIKVMLRNCVALNLNVLADSIMWLWRTHNIVNKILAKSQSEDPAFPKQQFPPASICAPCHNNDGFVESEVLNFLIAYYSDIKTDSAESSISMDSRLFVLAVKNALLGQRLLSLGAASKRFNPRFVVGVDKVDRLEQAEQRLRRENLDANPQRRWKHIDANDYVKPYDPSSGSHFFYLFWLSIMAAAIFITYMKYRRNRTKFWKTFYYYNDYKLMAAKPSHSGKETGHALSEEGCLFVCVYYCKYCRSVLGPSPRAELIDTITR
uniref:Sulfhydryl oxidase n=1 Tax=Parascaris equorum TaxID=6256 RepID=A0A914RYJ0_PAREQ